MASEETSWRTPTFRQSVIVKIDEAIQRSGMPTSKNSMEMENHVFQKAKTKEEYLGFVARLILHVREMNSKKGAGGMAVPANANPDPINALQTLARQGTGNNQMMGMGGPQGVGMGGPQGVGMGGPQGVGMGGPQGVGMGGPQGVGMGGPQGVGMGGPQGVGMGGPQGVGMGGPQGVGMGGPQGVGMGGPQGVGMGGPQGVGMGGPQGVGMGGPQGVGMGGPQGVGMGGPQGGGMGGPQGVGMGGPQGMVQQPQSQVAAAALLQSLNQRPGQGLSGLQSLQKMPEMGGMGPGSQIGPMGQMQNQMRVQMAGQMPGQMGGQMPPQMQGQMPGQMPGQMQPQMQGQMPGQMQPQMQGQMPIQMQGQMQNQMPHNVAQMQVQRKAAAGGMQGGDVLLMAGQPPGFGGPRNVAPSQFLRQSPSPSAQSPAPHSNQMAASPAMVPSPSPQHTPMTAPQRSVGIAASPGSSLNTPGQAVPTPSPCSLQEDQAYREKVRQLSKYIEPLRRMIAKMGNDGEQYVEKLSKMKKLLDILSNPSKRMPLETLLKCEVVLEKLDLKRGDSGGNGGSVPPPLPHLSTFKEHHIFNCLLEAVSTHMYSPVVNHTLQRTFGPCLEALFGPEIKMMPPPLKKKKVEDTLNDIPDVLQGEIARLDQRFKVSLDPTGPQPASRSVQLVCWLDDRHLPCVPPISVCVPDDYPRSPPRCHMAPHEYGATHFLSAVQLALESRISKLPSRFSVSQLLDTWEMSVRQASAPATVTPVPVSTVTALMGL